MSHPSAPRPAVVPPPVPVPTVDDAKVAQDTQDQVNRRRGRAATVLTGQQGDTTTPSLGASTALGL